MKTRRLMLVTGSSLLAIATSTPAQDTSTSTGFQLEEVVVSARRRDESLQDVPQTVNAVSGVEIEKFNFRKFEDISAVVPGLSMGTNANGIGATASVRGVNYDVNASGNNATVEFYMNDAPISAGNLFQTVYDIQQVELLRGPQGTLRGRASPSGSMTVTTRRPDLAEVGGYVSASGNDIGGYNGQGAIGFPLVTDKLAIRIAGAYDENEGNRVKSFGSTIDPSVESKSGRATLLFEPTDSLSFAVTYQKTDLDSTTFDQIESQQVLFPDAPIIPDAAGGTPRFIRAEDRRSVADAPRILAQEFENTNIQFQWAFAGQKLNYVGARNVQHMESQERGDIGNYFPSNFPPFAAADFGQFGQFTDANAKSYQHELRLSSEERVAGIFDYSVGAFYQEQKSPTDLTQATAILIPPGPPLNPAPGYAGTISETPISRRGTTEERSAFANLTAHVSEDLELSGGVRYIEFESTGQLIVAGNEIAAAAEDSKDDALIYTLAASYKFSDDLMAYFNTGTSWRPGVHAVGDFSVAPTPLELSFINLDPEESTSYEVGLKFSGLDRRLRGSIAAYYQDFENYPYRSASGVWYRTVASETPLVASVSQFNFVAAVPVEVYGVEAELAFAPTANWDMGVSAALAKGEIKDGTIPCTDVNPRDGIPDTGALPPGLFDPDAFYAASGNDNLSACQTTQRSSSAPQWSAALQSEYRVPMTPQIDGYVRGLLTLYGSSENDPNNPVDDYDGYELFNLYLGVRDPDGRWDVSLYGKNILETEEVLTRSSSTIVTSYRQLGLGATGVVATPMAGATNYYGGLAGNSASGLIMTQPREFGLMLRYSFGSR